MYAVTDGKAVGTYLEQKFQAYLRGKYTFTKGNSARGIDFPELGIDLKVTSLQQPQSSCPFKNARQKVYGLGYSLLIFVYEKHDDAENQTGCLEFRHIIFVEQGNTADYQLTTTLRRMLENRANRDDILACFEERLLPIAGTEAVELAEEILRSPPPVGYLTISNALQWRLQYSRAIEQAGKIPGLLKLQ